MRRFCALISLLPALAVISPAPSVAQIVSITIAPPVLPVYVQPPIPEPGYIWTPGYWAYGPQAYFWVPGTWVQPPVVGVLWTPGYWGWRDGIYVWNAGYWGPHIGFYGGVNYGFGYGGVGYEGGAWRGGVFSYNRSVNNFGSVNITNVYNKTVIVNNNASRVAFNGGTGGIAARPTPLEEAAMHEQHTPPTAAQTQHEHTASTNRENLASVNHGAPAIAATSKPGEFSGKGVVRASGAAPPARDPPAEALQRAREARRRTVLPIRAQIRSAALRSKAPARRPRTPRRRGPPMHSTPAPPGLVRRTANSNRPIQERAPSPATRNRPVPPVPLHIQRPPRLIRWPLRRAPRPPRILPRAADAQAPTTTSRAKLRPGSGGKHSLRFYAKSIIGWAGDTSAGSSCDRGPIKQFPAPRSHVPAVINR